MNKLLTILLTGLLFTGMVYSQSTDKLTELYSYDAITQITGEPGTPYWYDQGIREAVIAVEDMNGNGTPEILLTDYSNGGQIHVWEYNNSTSTAELIFSTIPVTRDEDTLWGYYGTRWARVADLDGDGNKEIVHTVDIGVAAFDSAQVWVWEYNGTNWGASGGTAPSLILDGWQFNTETGSRFRHNREAPGCDDFDGDGRDELILHFYNSVPYVIGVTGDIGSFANWNIEGGLNLDAVGQSAGWAGGSIWQALKGDFDGDGNDMDISIHHWDNYAHWFFKSDGADSYVYPDSGAAYNDVYGEFDPTFSDGCSYFGVTAADMNNDGRDEVYGLNWFGGDHVICLDLDASDNLLTPFAGDTAMADWDAQAILTKDEIYSLAINPNTGEPYTAGGLYHLDITDIDGDGAPELVIGSSGGYMFAKVDFVGADGDDVHDPANWEPTIIYGAESVQWFEVNYYCDTTTAFSTTVVDTGLSEAPFVSKFGAGGDVNGDGTNDVIATYQSVSDSITHTRWVWDDTSATEPFYVEDTTWKTPASKSITWAILEGGQVIGINDDIRTVTPDDYVLKQNYPNPFNPTTNVEFTLPIDKKISIKVYDILGREIKTLVNNEIYKAGVHKAEWDGTNNFGKKVSSGHYILTMKYGNFSKSVKMTLLK